MPHQKSSLSLARMLHTYLPLNIKVLQKCNACAPCHGSQKLPLQSGHLCSHTQMLTNFCRDVDIILAFRSLKQLRLLQAGISRDSEIGFRRLKSHCSLEEIQVACGDTHVSFRPAVDAGLPTLSALKVLSINLLLSTKVDYHRQYLKGVHVVDLRIDQSLLLTPCLILNFVAWTSSAALET